ncbi:phosphoribosyltransferase-like protein [Achromobacter deleyi]|uniref:phosphoribosyltransferase-like protein n=1 Tax=Achromobacter deleyi TaxID=1353891 RepID=UPI0014670C4D|nr:hypothetical protein [Achromobacter deleyi]CAB3913727.1 hypothetical protein LMG3412_04881 [Achromobacter deleyi]
MNSLNNIPDVDKWLSQFEVPDTYLAEHMLHRLRYVSFGEQEKWLQESVGNLVEDITQRDGRVGIAIFPVAKPFINEFNKNKEKKAPNDSGGRIAHSLTNLMRNMPEYVELTPRMDSMKKRRVRHIVFVDDFIGTGDRFIKSWATMVSPSIKAWCSRGWCKVWLLSFAAHQSGVSRVVHRIRPIVKERVRPYITIDESMFWKNGAMRTVLWKYGKDLGSARQVMGYGKLASPVIFQHGCPNNVPLIFWVRGNSKQKWAPLFPNRSVSTGVYPLFEHDWALNALPEELWMTKCYEAAVNVLDRLSDHKESHQLLLTVSLLAKKSSLDTIRSIIIASDDEFDGLLSKVRDGGLIDKNNELTRFGRDVLARFSKAKRHSNPSDGLGNFYPASFLGFQRNA